MVEAVEAKTQRDIQGAPPQPRGHWPIWSRPPLLWVRIAYLTLLNAAFSGLYRFVRSHYRLWRWSSRHYNPTLDGLAHLHAYLMCAWSKKRIPAYAQFLADSGHVFRIFELSSFPETSKESYVQRYGFAERCRDGRIPDRRHARRRVGRVVRQAVQLAALGEELQQRAPEHGQLGAVHVPYPAALRDQRVLDGRLGDRHEHGHRAGAGRMVKSTGPDLEKIVDTLERLRRRLRLPDRGVSAVPQARRRRLDASPASTGSDALYGLVGGEGMTEAMRDHLEQRLVKVLLGLRRLRPPDRHRRRDAI